MPKEVQFGVLESARLCLRTEKSYLAIAAPATAGRSVSGAVRSSLLPAKMLDALGTTKESILPSFYLWTNVGSTFVPPGRCRGVSQACKNLCTREVTTFTFVLYSRDSGTDHARIDLVVATIEHDSVDENFLVKHFVAWVANLQVHGNSQKRDSEKLVFSPVKKTEQFH